MREHRERVRRERAERVLREAEADGWTIRDGTHPGVLVAERTDRRWADGVRLDVPRLYASSRVQLAELLASRGART